MVSIRKPRIQWKKPSKPLEAMVGLLSVEVKESAPPVLTMDQAVRTAVMAVGLPSTADAATPKEDLIGLLKLAAEVEHALMVQYLYAAMSLKGGDNRQVAHVAVQEMGHFVTAQNLLLALGGVGALDGLPVEYHFGRDELRKLSSKNPLPFSLQAISHSVLAQFVVVESPGVIPDDTLRARVEQLTQEATQAGGGPPHPVHALYAKIRWILQPTDTPFGSMKLSADPELGFISGWHVGPGDFADAATIDRYAETPVEWGSVPALVIGVAHNASEACAVVDQITEQGEGLGAGEDSHFQQFLQLLDKFEASNLRVSPLPRTPYVSGQIQPEDPSSTKVTDSYAELWGHLFNTQYSLLILDLARALSLPNTDAKRSGMVAIAQKNMQQSIRGLASHLCQDLHSGPPYGLNDETIPNSWQLYRNRYTALLTQQQTVIQAIQMRPEYQTCLGGNCQIVDFTGDIQLQLIAGLNNSRQPLLP